MIYLSVKEIIFLHEKMISKTGGSHGLRDCNLLESAVFNALSSYDGQELYPSVEEKSARLMFALTKNHAFADGNKRIGVLVMLMTLQLNEKTIVYSQKELIRFGLSVADGSFSYDDILCWLQAHLKE